MTSEEHLQESVQAVAKNVIKLQFYLHSFSALITGYLNPK